MRWVQADRVSKRVASELLSGAEVVASALGIASSVVTLLMGDKGKVAGTIGLLLGRLAPSMEEALKSAGSKVKASENVVATKQENLAATLEGFRRDLDAGEEAGVLARSVG